MQKDVKIKFMKNLVIMNSPVVLLIIWLGGWFVIPLAVSIAISSPLAGNIEVKDAISYPFVQHTFILLYVYLFWAYPNTGLALMPISLIIYGINAVVVYSYFRAIQNKTWRGKVLVLAITLLVTLFMFSESYGQNRSTPVLFRMLRGDFGDSSWTREHIRTDTAQITSDGFFEYRLEQVYRSTPLRTNTELKLVVRNLSTKVEYRIRLDDVMGEDSLPRLSMPHNRDYFWSTMQPADEMGQIYLLTTTSEYSIPRRWVFRVDMETQTVGLLEPIHVGMIGRTADDRHIAYLYMVNFFDENRSVRLAMRDRITAEIIPIPIDIDVTEVIVSNFGSDWFRLQPSTRGVEITLTNSRRVYTVVLQEGFLERERRFELNMNTRTMRELN